MERGLAIWRGAGSVILPQASHPAELTGWSVDPAMQLSSLPWPAEHSRSMHGPNRRERAGEWLLVAILSLSTLAAAWLTGSAWAGAGVFAAHAAACVAWLLRRPPRP